jgi:hypothetical protein
MGKLNSYINNMIQQYGNDWVNAMTPDNIQRNAKRIVKDMSKGAINYETQGACFLDPKFMDNLIIAINNELEINTLNYNACSFYMQYFPNTPNIGSHIYHTERLIHIYTTVLNKLNMVKSTGNIGFLADVAG